MIKVGSRVTYYEDEDHEFPGVVVNMGNGIQRSGTGSVLVQFDEDPPNCPEEVKIADLEED